MTSRLRTLIWWMPQLALIPRRRGRHSLIAALLGLLSFAGGCAPLAAPALLPPQKPPVEFLGAWGEHGRDPGQLASPVAIATDTFGMAYILDSATHSIQKFSSQGHPLLSFQPVSLRLPLALAVDSGGAIYVADGAARHISIYSPQGDFLRAQRRMGQREFGLPAALTVDADGNLYVVDSQRAEVTMFDPRGRLKKVWGRRGEGPGEFQMPSSIALGPDGSVYVSEKRNRRVQKFNRDGGLVTAWTGQVASEQPLKYPGSIAAGEAFVVVFDPFPPRLVFWTPEGKPLHVLDLGDHLEKRGDVDAQAYLALAGKDELLLLDFWAQRVLRFRVHF
jgi:tripartite motif-containing protein 71